MTSVEAIIWIIVASLLWWLPVTGRTTAVDYRPAAAASTTSAAVAAVAAADFSVNMILPFSKSTIRYSYTEPSSSGTVVRTPSQMTDVDQAHSMKVSQYGCGTVVGGGQRKRKRVRWNTVTSLPAEQSADGATRVQSQANTVMPLPGYPTADAGRGIVFEAAAEHLDQLYTVSRVDGRGRGPTTSGKTDAEDDNAK